MAAQNVNSIYPPAPAGAQLIYPLHKEFAPVPNCAAAYAQWAKAYIAGASITPQAGLL